MRGVRGVRESDVRESGVCRDKKKDLHLIKESEMGERGSRKVCLCIHYRCMRVYKIHTYICLYIYIYIYIYVDL